MPDDSLSFLVLIARRSGELERVSDYLSARYPRSRCTFVLPDDVALDAVDPSAIVLSYPKGKGSTLLEKGRTVRALMGKRFHYCLLPFDFSSYRQYAKLFLLLLFVRFEFLLILAEDGRVHPYRRVQWGGVLLRAAIRGLLRRILQRVHIRTWLDLPLFFGLIFYARFRFWITRILDRFFHRKKKARDSLPRVDAAPRVVHFISAICIGGAQRQLLTLVAEQCRKNGCPTVVVLDASEAFYAQHFSDLSVSPLYLLAESSSVHTGRWRVYFERAFPQCAATLKLASFLAKDGGYDILHCWLFTSNMIGAVAGRIAGIPIVLSSERNISHWKKIWFGPWTRWAERLTAPMNERVIVNARVLADDFAGWAHFDRERIVTIFNGIDPRSFPAEDVDLYRRMRRDLGLPERTLLIGWIGRLEREKDPFLLLRAAERLISTRQDVFFLVMGSGKLARVFLEQIEKSGMNERIRCLGEQRDVYRFMQGMDCLWLTSIVEGMPNVLIEAQFLGVPCVTTDAGGAGEVVENEKTGFVVPVGDEKAIVEKTQRLLEDPDLRNRYRVAGRARANALFRADRMVEETRRLYEHLLSERQGVHP